MTAPVRNYSPATKMQSANVGLVSALAKVPSMFRAGMSLGEVEDHILVHALVADGLYAEASDAQSQERAIESSLVAIRGRQQGLAGVER